MARHKDQGSAGGHFYCTFSCWNWLWLIEESALYDHLYAWMERVTGKGCKITGFVFMPNHVHLLVYVPAGSSINKILSNMKRFAAYEVVRRLKARSADDLLAKLAGGTLLSENARGQVHKIWNYTSDIRPSYGIQFTRQKLDYIHRNPVSGKWKLVEDLVDYPHSSAAFYERGTVSRAPLVHYLDVVPLG